MKVFYFCHKHCKSTEPISLMRLTFHELTIVLNGSLEYIINRKHISIKSGEAIFVKKGSLRERDSTSFADYISFNFYADEEELANVYPPLHLGEVSNDILLLLSACNEIYVKTMGDNNYDSIGLILQCILKQISFNLKMRSLHPLALQIMQYVRKNLDKQITLAEIGKVTNFSPAYCSSVFKKETGKSIVDYILEEKINEAKRLMLDGMRLSKIAEQLGFASYNYFSRTFKKHTNYSPLQYKATLLNLR